jgi:hypothetical protein
MKPHACRQCEYFSRHSGSYPFPLLRFASDWMYWASLWAGKEGTYGLGSHMPDRAQSREGRGAERTRFRRDEGEKEATLEKMQDEGNEGNHSALSYFPADAAL